MRIPISSKLIGVTISILLGTTIPIAVITSDRFREVSSQREDTTNLDSAIAKSKEVENIFSSFIDKTKTYGAYYLKVHNVQGSTNTDETEYAFLKDKDFYGIQVYEFKNGSIQLVTEKVKSEQLKQSQLNEQYLSNVRRWQKFPLVDVAKDNGSIQIKNATYDKKLALFTIGIPLVRDVQSGLISHIAVADISLASVQKPFSEPGVRVRFLVNQFGELLAHTDESRVFAREDMNENKLVGIAKSQSATQGQKKFSMNDTNENLFGAYVKSKLGLTVFSQIPEEVVLAPARQVRNQALYITGLAIALSILVIFLVSVSLTSPIERLAGLIKVVSKGNFDVKARAQVKSHDEVGDLASAFDQMTEGLKERDKVKTLFSKFHGSSVAEEMIKSDLSVGGQNKEVVVFFSDIRGFTAYSEKRSPEEVVEMLNEYFGTMVTQINKHEGIVDKFIGDAIMAVWGAPKNGPKDAHHAVRACIEMRIQLAALNEKRIARGQDPINIGMGLHAGRAISGTIGSQERMEYTVIGNTVNTASRIEASTKAFGADLLISDDVLARVGDDFLVEKAGAAEVKGRSEPLNLYKVKGYKDPATGKYVEVKTKYSDYEKEHADKVKVAAA